MADQTFEEFQEYSKEPADVYRPGANFEAERQAASAASNMIRGNLPEIENFGRIMESLSISVEKLNTNLEQTLELNQDQLDVLNRSARVYDRMNTVQKQGNDLRRQGANEDQKSLRHQLARRQAQEAEADAAKRVLELQKARGSELVAQLKTYGLIDEQTRKVRLPGGNPATDPSVAQVRQAHEKARRGQSLSASEDQMINQVYGTVKSVSIMHGRTEDQGGGLGGILQQAASGNIAALLPLLLSRPSPALFRRMGERVATRGQESSLPGSSMMGSMLGRGIGGLGSVARFLPPAAAIYGGMQAFETASRYNQAALRVGSLTGEGRMAGLESARQVMSPFGPRGLDALNPFDMVSNSMARQINQAIRAGGIRGGAAGAMTDAVADVVNDLGIDFQEAVDIAMSSVRDGGLTLSEFRERMEDLDDIAKNTGTSVQTAAASMRAFTDQVTSTGGRAAGRQAAAAFPGLQTALSAAGPGMRAFLGSDAGKSFLPTIQPVLAQRFGLAAPWAASSQEQIKQMAQQLDQFLSYLREAGRQSGMSADGWAQYVKFIAGASPDPMFQALAPMSVEAIRELLAMPPGKFAGQIKKSDQARLQESADELKTRAARAGEREGPSLWQNSGIMRTWRGITGDSGPSFAETIKNPREYGQQIRRELTAANVEQGRINQIMAPLAGAITRGDQEAWQRAVEGVTAQAEKEIRVQINAAPELRPMMDSATGWSAVTTGKRASQGTHQLSRVSRQGS